MVAEYTVHKLICELFSNIQLLLGNYVKLWSFAEMIKQGCNIKCETTYNCDEFMMGISIRQCWFTRCSPESLRSLTMKSMNLSKGQVFIKNCQVEVLSLLSNNSNIQMTCAFRWWLQPKQKIVCSQFDHLPPKK